APQFWRLLCVLLDARNRQNVLDEDKDQNMEPGESYEEDTYWEDLGEGKLEGATVGGGPRKDSTKSSKNVVLLGILMQSTNRKSNDLQSLTGLLFQSMHTPQSVIETLAQMGISV
ncbi:hypothetical protein PAXRUDRAFT_116600, partial [Paxillus rubicundulus Ve08.2h10]